MVFIQIKKKRKKLPEQVHRTDFQYGRDIKSLESRMRIWKWVWDEISAISSVEIFPQNPQDFFCQFNQWGKTHPFFSKAHEATPWMWHLFKQLQ